MNDGEAQAGRPVQKVAFDRKELGLILDLYGRKVAAGEWKDYAMDFLADRAEFSIHRRASEAPLYRIVKTPEMRTRQGQYQVVAATGLILKRGNELARVLQVLETRLRLVNA